MLEISCCTSILSEDCATIAILVLVDNFNCVLESVDVHYTHAGSEDFLLVYSHVRSHVIEHGRTYVKSVRRISHFEVSSVKQQFCAFWLSSSNQLVNSII